MIERLDPWVRTKLLPATQLVLWLFLYLTVLLGSWVVLGWSIGGWSPVVVTSGSMEPTLSAGDVLLIETDVDDNVAQRAIIVFEREDAADLVAHRVFAVEADGYVTKGDANASPDADRVSPEEVVGAGRLVVPLVGLPVVWADEGKLAPLVAWLLLTVVGLTHLAVLGARRVRSGRERITPTDMPIALQGIRRVRVLVAVLILVQYILEPSRFDVLGDSSNRVWVLVVAMVVLFGTNFVSLRVVDVKTVRVMAIAELSLDTALVILLATLTGSSGVGWVLFALPIIEAAVRFRLAGALMHWMVLTIVTMTARIWTAELTQTGNVLDELETILDQLSVLFLVVVPGAYLAEQLIGDVASQQQATGRAVDRGALLELVAESGREVVQLGGEPLAAIVEGTRRLGFDRVDLFVTSPEGRWRQIGGDVSPGLPPPGRPGSGLREQDLAHPAVVIDHQDDELAEVVGLDLLDLEAVLVRTVSEKEGTRVLLRAGLDHGHHLTAAQLDAFSLLAGQASVALRNDELLSEITVIQAELARQAEHDPLTGLANRVLLLRELLEAMNAADARPAVLFLDLDGFKPVNDRLGHEVGDSVLRLVANRLVRAAPEGSLVARVGGDEFTIVVPGHITDEMARQISEKVWHRIREPFEVGGDLVRISTSIGVAFAEEGLTGAEAIRRADVAMYKAKHGSLEDVVCEIYRDEFDDAEERRGKLIAGIARALQTDQLRLVYQPIYPVETGSSLAGVEALLRWTHSDFGEVPPGEIIEAARAAKVRDELNKWIVHKACLDAADWAERHPEQPFFVAVNASPEELSSRELVSNVNEALRVTGLRPDRLYVEISEKLVTPDAPEVVANMTALREAGVGLLLDDFGQGQISLTHLHGLPVDGIKLDRDLVVHSLRSKTDQIVLESIVDLCRRLELVVIAEGVETREHLDAVTLVGCHLVQGYFLDRPESANYIADLLAGADRSDVSPDGEPLLSGRGRV